MFRPQGSGTVKTALAEGVRLPGSRLDDAELYDGMSTWYRLAYLNGGTRLQVFEHSPWPPWVRNRT